MSTIIQKALRLPTFSGGVHPQESKAATRGVATTRLPFPGELVLPLSQHIGKPAVPLVAAGDRVLRGQMIARPDGFISTAVHAPVTGKVVAVERRPHPGGGFEPAIVIATDPFSDQQVHGPGPVDVDSLAPAEVIRRVQEAGLVGLGGAAFPSHVKFSVPEGKRVHTVILNGCECEPYLTCDHRIMLERPLEVVRGLEILMQKVGAERGAIGVENNKADAVEVLRQTLAGNERIEVFALQVKYPQGAEKMLIDAIYERQVPAGKLPLDIEMVVNNVGTSAAVADLFDRGVPLIERVVTVTGDGVARPSNLIVPIGSPLSAVLEHCGVDPGTGHVILGGPMMGQSQKRLDVPIIKGTSGVLTMRHERIAIGEEMACIRCGRCLEACPMFLNPSRLAILARAERIDDLEGYHVADCFECASCSYVCPSRIPLVQLIRLGKALVRDARRRQPNA